MLLSLSRLHLSEGERAILTSCLTASVIGAWIAYVVEHRLAGGQSLLALPTLYDVWLLLAGGVSAVAAIYLGHRWLGHSGLKGLGRTIVGALVITFVAALIGGTIALPIYGTMFGPLALVGTFVDQPLLLLLWVTAVLGSNLAFGLYRRERDTIFREDDF